jgi:putative flippase GtrA
MLIMFLGVTIFGFNDKIIKIISQIIVILGNYVLSKLFVFNKK